MGSIRVRVKVGYIQATLLFSVEVLHAETCTVSRVRLVVAGSVALVSSECGVLCAGQGLVYHTCPSSCYFARSHTCMPDLTIPY